MDFDYDSVLAAVGAAGAALCFTLFTNWLRQRRSGFLMSWALAMGVVVASVVMFGLHNSTLFWPVGLAACVLLTTAISIASGGLVQFRDGKFPLRRVVYLSIATGLPSAVAFASGYQGLAYIIVNGASAALLIQIGWGFWHIRKESPTAIVTIAGLHVMLGISFALCALVIIQDGAMQIEGGLPQNWAEILNLICAVIAITGIGGLFITIHQERIARAHETASLTDSLTGLANRRALYDRFEARDLPVGSAVVIFDLDDFKGVNDRFGHGFGDQVLIRFAQLLSAETRPQDMNARLGGEEFCVVVEDVAEGAFILAERVRAEFMAMRHTRGSHAIGCTVSAGVAVVEGEPRGLDTMLRKADNALYLSKRNGRNQVSRSGSRRAA